MKFDWYDLQIECACNYFPQRNLLFRGVILMYKTGIK